MMKRKAARVSVSDAARQLFSLAQAIDGAQHIGEVMSFTLAKRARPDLYRVLCAASQQELASALDELEQERAAGRIEAAA